MLFIPAIPAKLSAPQLEIGDYQITVEKDGFKSFNQDVVVRSGEKTRVDVGMEIGKVETVVVESSANTDSRRCHCPGQRLPSALRRPWRFQDQAHDPVAYATLSPGAVPVTKDDPFLDISSFNSDGSRGRANDVTLDGVTASDISTTADPAQPCADAAGSQSHHQQFERQNSAQFQLHRYR